MKRYIGLTLFLFSFLLAQPGNAQQPAEEQKLAEFVNKINTFNNLYTQEKVYLHFDNTGYFKGEAIWFKAYVVTSEDNSFSPLSKVLHVELLSPEGDIVEAKKLKIVNGQADGGFILDEKLFTGYYEVRAYTQCMLNFGENVVFSRVFPVFDPPKKPGDYSEKKMTVRGRELRIENKRKEDDKNKSKEINMDFFPEGGNIINGLPNRIAFKVTDKQGMGLDVSGKIVNSTNEEITALSTMHLGMGSFELVPDGKKYSAKIEYNGKQHSFDLPEVMPSGYTIRVDNIHPKMLSIQVNNTPDAGSRTMGITFACRGKVYAYKAFSTDEQGVFSLRIPKESLPTGVIQITLFTPEGDVLAQRQTFINHNQFLPIKLTEMPTSIEPFEPVKLSFKVTDTGDNPVKAAFSLAVRDTGGEIGTNNTDNIMYNLLLGSELKGYIEDPAFYFSDIDNRKIAALDLLMMTQGWVRYPWKQMAGIEPFEVKYGIEECLIVEGKVLSPAKANPEAGVDVSMWMYSPYGSSQQGKCITEDDGYFNFGLADIYGKWDMTLVTKKKDKPVNTRIVINRNISPQPLQYSPYETRLGPVKKQNNIINDQVMVSETNHPAQRLNNENENITMSYVLDEITINEKAKWTRKDQGSRYANIIYDVQNEVDKIRDSGGSEPTKLLDFLENTNEYFQCFGDDCKYKQRPTIFYLDLQETPVSDDYSGKTNRSTFLDDDLAKELADNTARGARNIRDIDISEVEDIMIAENDPTVYATIGKEGVAIYIFTNESGGRRKEPIGIRNTSFYGFTPPMEFYSPDYTYGRLPDEKDFRRTLYWNPNVETDIEGNASVQFFNNGMATDINISAEGLLNGGIPVLLDN